MIKSLQKWIIDTFGFSKSETNGSLILISLIILVAVLPRLFINKYNHNEVSEARDSVALKDWIEAYQQIVIKEKSEEMDEFIPKTTNLEPSPFNPNLVSIEKLKSFGLPPNIAKNMVGYREAGGTFKSKSDIQKIYGMDDKMYEKIKDFILLPEEQPIQYKSSKKISETYKPLVDPEPAELIDINFAHANELQIVNGIGPKLSERIIKYRDLVGGFYSSNQLTEVYGLNEEVIHKLNDQIIINDQGLVKIDINDIELKDLSRHPYVNYSLSKTIINYRKIHGPFQNISDLKKIKIVSDSLFNKLSPYISLGPE